MTSVRRFPVQALALLTLLVLLDGARAHAAQDLLDLFARARESDPVFQSALNALDASREGLREARAGVLPALTANLSGSKTNQDIVESNNLLFTEGRSDFFNSSVGVSITQPVYRYDVMSRIPQSRLESLRAEYEFAAAEQDLILRVAQAHFGALAALDDLEFAVAERGAIEQQLRVAEERLGLGLARITDVHDARAQFALASASEIEARFARDDSLQAIAEIIGTPPVDLKLLSDSFPLTLPGGPLDADGWVHAARFQNPDLKVLETEAEVAAREIARQRAARRPNVDVVASFTRSDSGGTVFGGGNEIATTDVALRVGIPIYDGGATSARTRAAILRQRTAEQAAEQLRRQTERETRRAYLEVAGTAARVEALQQSVRSQEAALAEKEEGVRSGLNTGLDVLNAVRDLYRARRDLTRARYVFIVGRLRLHRAAGNLTLENLKEINDYLQ